MKNIITFAVLMMLSTGVALAGYNPKLIKLTARTDAVPEGRSIVVGKGETVTFKVYISGDASGGKLEYSIYNDTKGKAAETDPDPDKDETPADGDEFMWDTSDEDLEDQAGFNQAANFTAKADLHDPDGSLHATAQAYVKIDNIDLSIYDAENDVALTESEEESPGAFVAKNGARRKMVVVVHSLVRHDVTLWINDTDAGNVEVYETETGETELTTTDVVTDSTGTPWRRLWTNRSSGTSEQTFWVEGKEFSDSNEFRVSLSDTDPDYRPDSVDTVHLSVVDVQFQDTSSVDLNEPVAVLLPRPIVKFLWVDEASIDSMSITDIEAADSFGVVRELTITPAGKPTITLHPSEVTQKEDFFQTRFPDSGTFGIDPDQPTITIAVTNALGQTRTTEHGIGLNDDKTMVEEIEFDDNPPEAMYKLPSANRLFKVAVLPTTTKGKVAFDAAFSYVDTSSATSVRVPAGGSISPSQVTTPMVAVTATPSFGEVANALRKHLPCVEVDMPSQAHTSVTVTHGGAAEDTLAVYSVDFQKIPLGGSLNLNPSTLGTVYIPTKWGGQLTLEGGNVELFYTDGSAMTWALASQVVSGSMSPVAQGNPCSYAVPKDKFGWYYVKTTSHTSVSAKFEQSKKVTKEPWKCPMFPMSDEQAPNFYDIGGCLDKYDTAYGKSSKAIEYTNIMFGGGFCAKDTLIELDAERTLGVDLMNEDGDDDDKTGWTANIRSDFWSGDPVNGVLNQGDGDYDDTGDASWFGHCDQATAAVICENEPSQANFNAPQNVQFTQDLKKGLLVALYQGFTRTREGPDIKPHVWHRCLEENILGKDSMFACDTHNSGPNRDIIWNFPVYEMVKVEYRQKPGQSDEKVIEVTSHTNCWVHYEGVAKPLYYLYNLTYNSLGIADSSDTGDWGKHELAEEDEESPDYVWHPELKTSVSSHWQGQLDYTKIRAIVPAPAPNPTP